MNGSFKYYILLLAAVFTPLTSVFAAIPTQLLPSTVEPAQVQRAIFSQEIKPVPRTSAPITPPEAAPTPFGKEAEQIKFKLTKVTIKGNTVYSDKDLAVLYKDKINKVISVVELYGIVQSVTNYYRNNGYILSRAVLPPQRVQNGAVTIQVIEGFISKANVIGKPGKSEAIVKRYANNIVADRPLQLKVMERYILIMNEVPGVDARAILAPSEKTTGAAELNLDTQLQRITGYVSYDNYGTRYIGPQQWTANVTANSVLTSGDATQVLYAKTPRGKELTFLDISYNRPFGDKGWRWMLGGNQATTNPLFTLAPLKIQGNVEDYYGQLFYPLIRTRSKSLNIEANFEYLDSSTTTFGDTLYADHIRSLSAGGNYNFTDSYKGVNLISVLVEKGFPLLGATTDPTSLTTSRFGATGVYTKVNTVMSRSQGITENISLYAMMQGQYSFSPLLAAEQFAYGGSQLGRGYDPAEIVGDRGLAGTGEFRLNMNPGRLFLQSLQFYAFYDIGAIWNIENVPGQPQKQSAASTGIGTRFYFNQHFSGNLMLGQPLTKQVAAEELIGNGRRPRVFFNLVGLL